jgi:ATP-dependent DNA ligase
MALPVNPPFEPMLAKLTRELPPAGANVLYEPKWDGFRCIAFKDGESVELQSKAGQPLARYFPEVVAAVRALAPRQFVLDGEIAIPVKKIFSFDDLLQRIHPAESRVRKLSKELPAILIVFDLLVDEKGSPRRRDARQEAAPLGVSAAPSREEREHPPFPATTNRALARGSGCAARARSTAS